MCDNVGPQSTSLHLLTRREYDATIRDLLGDPSNPAQSTFPKEPLAFGFENNINLYRVTPESVSRYLDAAETLASTAVRTHKASLVDCVGHEDEPCGERFVVSFGRRAFRRPLSDAEVSSFVDLFRRTLMADTFDGALEGTISAMLQSPQFLYRNELGDGAPQDPKKLNGFEVASKLSYFFWGTMPDDALFDAAAGGRLNARDGIELEARRLLEDPKAHDGSTSFFRQYLGLETMVTTEKDVGTYPNFNPQMGQSWLQSINMFLDRAFWTGGTLRGLLTDSTVFVDPMLAPMYSLGGPTPTGFDQKATGDRYVGLLAQPALMAKLAGPNQSSPVRRGVFIFATLLCQPLPPPPANINIQPPTPVPNATTRQLFAAHSSSAMCQGCHGLIDPLGFGLENYDGLGVYRDTQNGKPIDATGEIKGAREASLNGKFNGPKELAEKLAGSRQVHDCVSVNMYRYAIGRVETQEDQCALNNIQIAFFESGGDFRTLGVKIATSDTFRFRKAAP
jgi:hypothetical protein